MHLFSGTDSRYDSFFRKALDTSGNRSTMQIQLFGQFRIGDVRLGLNKSQHLQILFTYSRVYSRISITYSRIYSRICHFYSLTFKLNTCTENILFKKWGCPP